MSEMILSQRKGTYYIMHTILPFVSKRALFRVQTVSREGGVGSQLPSIA